MKHSILFIFSCIFIITGIYSLKILPSDSAYLIEKKYSSWTGVLHVWVTKDTNSTNWLNACAAEFEKENPGLYINIEEVPLTAISNISKTNLTLPDIIIYPISLSPDTSSIIPVTRYYPLRQGIKQNPYATPILLHAKFWIYNTSSIEAFPTDTYDLKTTCNPEDLNSLVALCTGLRSENQAPQSLPGLDLGLNTDSAPPSISSGNIECRTGPNLTLSETPENLFISGQSSAFIGGIDDILKLPSSISYSAILTGDYVYTNSAVMFSILNKENPHTAACSAYLDTLMTYGQSITARARAFPAITGIAAWSGDIFLNTIEAALESRRWVLGISGTSNAAQLYIEEKISADNAMALIIGDSQ